MNRDTILDVIFKSLADEGIVVLEGTAPATIQLIGRGALLKSITLVAFLVGVEQRLSDATGRPISLMDERAMSQSRSPFRNVATLADYLEELIQSKN